MMISIRFHSDMKTRTCKVCAKTDSETEFYESIATHCKEHWKLRVRANRRGNIEYYREYDRKRGSRQSIGYLKQWRAANPEKYKAHCALNNAVRDGKVIKEPCFMCGGPMVDGHHVDYEKPLEVVWLCSGCHSLIHAYEDVKSEITKRAV